jgi:hypothetical protein
MITVQVEGKDVQVQPTDIKLPDGYLLVTPDFVPEGVVRESAVTSVVAKRLHDEKQKMIKTIHEDADVKSKVLDSIGIRLDESGKPVGVVQADVDGLKKTIYKEVKEDFDKRTKPIERQNKVLAERALFGELKASASTAGVKDGLLDMFVRSYASEFGLDENGSVYLRDGDSFKIDPSTGTNVTPSAWISNLRKDPTKADFFTNTQQRGTGSGSQASYVGAVTKKADLKTATDKSAYIAQHGSAAYLNLP